MIGRGRKDRTPSGARTEGGQQGDEVVEVDITIFISVATSGTVGTEVGEHDQDVVEVRVAVVIQVGRTRKADVTTEVEPTPQSRSGKPMLS